MKVSVQKANALGELVVVECDGVESADDPRLVEIFKISDRRMLEMNHRIIVATEIERRHGPDVAMAVREVTQVMFGTKPLSEEQIKDAYDTRKAAMQDGTPS